MLRRGVLVAVALLVTVGVGTASGGPPPSAKASAGVTVTVHRTTESCSNGKVGGGEWPSLNGDLRNTRHQEQERAIGVLEAARLEPAWTFDLKDLPEATNPLGPLGGLRSTPVTQGGCVYVAAGQGYLGDRGDVVALDADTGQLVWHAVLNGSVLGLAVHDGLVYATPSRGARGAGPTVGEDYEPGGSYAVALDARDGRLRWVSQRLDDENPVNGTFVNASPVVYSAGGRDLLFVPLSGGGGDGARVPMYFLDARSGGTVARALSLTEEDYKAGYGGTGIWSTAAYDQATGHLYAGTADSDGKTMQHAYNNAVLKIDGNPSRSTFAEVVGHYRGLSERADVDRHTPGWQENPLCSGEGLGGQRPTFFDTSAAPECLELDLDFGASPQLHDVTVGKKKKALRVAALQKAGVLHDVDVGAQDRTTGEMRASWRAVAGPGGAAMSAATGAVGPDPLGLTEDLLYVGGTPNLLQAVDAATGRVRWASQTGVDAFAYQPLTLANGVLYTVTDTGQLLALDALTGAAVLQRSVHLDLVRDGATGADAFRCLGAGAGVAVARHTVYVPCDGGGKHELTGTGASPGALVAYRVGAVPGPARGRTAPAALRWTS